MGVMGVISTPGNDIHAGFNHELIQSGWFSTDSDRSDINDRLSTLFFESKDFGPGHAILGENEIVFYHIRVPTEIAEIAETDFLVGQLFLEGRRWFGKLVANIDENMFMGKDNPQLLDPFFTTDCHHLQFYQPPLVAVLTVSSY